VAGSVEHHGGGIFSLCRLIERYAEAIEFDLLVAGRSLDDLGWSLSWRDLLVLIKRWQRVPGTATSEAITGVVHWATTDQLLAYIYDALQTGNWQRAGKKSAPKPKPFPRPWQKPAGQKLGSKPIPISEFDDWWDSQAKGA
jgi:hypothetical protein